MRHVAFDQRGLAGQGHQFDVARGVQHRLAERCDRRECGREIDLLEGTRPEHLDIDLARQRQHGRAVDLCVPQAGHQVGRTRPGN